jgi:hypothetical protein|eukprot:SAG25_NODE_653_length_6144_cov_5.294624_3_plen_66_part_00
MVLGMATSYLGIGLVRGEVHVRILKRDEVHRLLSCHITLCVQNVHATDGQQHLLIFGMRDGFVAE